MEINPGFRVPEIFRAHAETLVAAAAIQTFEEPLPTRPSIGPPR
jgi:hypothetical protein